MASLDAILTRKALAKGSVQVSRDDTPVSIRMRYVSTGTVTSVTVTTATNIVTITVEPGSVTTTKTYAFATYSTVGKLVAAINADGLFQARALDSLLADATTSSQFVTGAITAGSDTNGVTVWDVLVDTDVALYMTSTLSLHRNWDVRGVGHRVNLQEIVYLVDVNAASANAVRVYQRSKLGVETQLLGIASVDATKTAVSWASGLGVISGDDDADIIVRVQDATSLTDGTGNFLQVTGTLE